MAVSLNLPTLPNLYCNEAATEVVSREADDDECEIVTFASDSDSFIDYDEDSLINMFDSEVDQMLESKVLSSFYDLPDIVNARQEAVQWMLKVHSFYRFKPETAYLSINYLDRFLSARALPQGKGWPMQLLSVSCLSLAAKMEETTVPFLLDFQIIKPRILFNPKTVQRMELLVMDTLKWRLRTITPFDFVHYFISTISCIKYSQQNSLCHLYSCASDIIISTCKAIDSLDYPPSAFAAAVALWLTNHSVDDQDLAHLGCLQNRVHKEMVKKIYKIIQGKMSSLEPLPPSPTGVLDAAIQGSCKLQKIGNKNMNSSYNNSQPNKC
ncbi:cyclin-D1-1-like isoform X2 [Durio zibethinus]|uniref:Cyclin-D1-1-like isoform X2 n=1 Tax=Durio zibethinus TaxID=66656 RepID=A0A6P6BDD1_DURZI|nr:cyclin-D1-1-like isoform X2 [Durio zibethinus]